MCEIEREANKNSISQNAMCEIWGTIHTLHFEKLPTYVTYIKTRKYFYFGMS